MCRNQIGFIGAKHLADALSENHVRNGIRIYVDTRFTQSLFESIG